jgi:TldD protein
LKDFLFEQIKKSTAFYTELRIEKKITNSIEYRKHNLEVCKSSEDIGGIVRCLSNGGFAISTFNNLNEIDKKIKSCSEKAYLLGSYLQKDKKEKLYETKPVIDEIKKNLTGDFRTISLSKKKDLLKNYNQIMLDCGDEIISTQTRYYDQFIEYYYANSEGTYIFEERPDISLHLIALARNGGIIQTALDGTAGSSGFNIVEGLDTKAKEVGSRAIELLSAHKVKGGIYDVVLDQTLAGTFAHEAFGHLSEADFVYENKKLQELLTLGKKVGSKNLNILDNGAYPNLRATHKYDDEGVKTQKNYLIRDGVLVGRLHSRETAAKMNEPPTGNARSVSYMHEPIVRMTNTYIDKGDVKFTDLIKDIKLGVYAKDFFGGNTALELFTFSAAYGYMIRDGKICELVRDIVLSGNLFQTLHNIELIGSDLEFTELGGCGKYDQYPLAAPTGSPHIKIKNIIVGGA